MATNPLPPASSLDQQIAAQFAVVNQTSDAVVAGVKPVIQNEQAWWTPQNAMTISTVVLGFGVLVICIAAYLIRQRVPHNAVLRVLGTVLILVLAVFLVVAGYSDKQIASVLGLLGTVAGYLLGKSDAAIGAKSNESSDESRRP